MENKNSNIGYKIIIFVLLLVIAFFIYDKIKSTKSQQETLEQVEISTHQKDSLQNELQDLYLTYNSLQTDNEALNDSLQEQKERVEELMTKLKNTKSTDKYQIQQLKKEVETLKSIMKSYIRQIDSLYQQNQILIVENKKIKNQYTEVIQEKTELEQKTDSLTQTVKIAQKLTAYSINFNALNKRGKTTERIRKTKKFKVCFMLSENQVASKGKKNVYIRITKPDDYVLTNSKSGYFNYQDKSIMYSAVKEINYDGSKQDICMYYNVEAEDLPKGKYTVFIFVDGYQIGDYSITLK